MLQWRKNRNDKKFQSSEKRGGAADFIVQQLSQGNYFSQLFQSSEKRGGAADVESVPDYANMAFYEVSVL